MILLPIIEYANLHDIVATSAPTQQNICSGERDTLDYSAEKAVSWRTR